MSDGAVQLVEESVDPAHPTAIRNQLAQQVRKLLREHIAKDLLADALREWDAKPGSPPSWLPHMLSDVIRRRRAQSKEDQQRTSMTDWEEQLKKELNG